MRTDLEDPPQPYRHVLDSLRAAIRDQKLKPGDKLPSTRKLAESHGVALMTATRALQQLRAEGVIVTRQGVGSFVRHTQPSPKDEATGDVLEMITEIRQEMSAMQDRLSRLESMIA